MSRPLNGRGDAGGGRAARVPRERERWALRFQLRCSRELPIARVCVSRSSCPAGRYRLAWARPSRASIYRIMSAGAEEISDDKVGRDAD